MGKNIYCFGGYDGSSHFNDLHNLNLETFQWTKIHSRNDQTNWPIPKSGCGLVSIDETTLCCFGGYGIDPPQPGSLPGRKKWTREFHLFNLQKGIVAVLCVFTSKNDIKCCAYTCRSTYGCIL